MNGAPTVSIDDNIRANIVSDFRVIDTWDTQTKLMEGNQTNCEKKLHKERNIWCLIERFVHRRFDMWCCANMLFLYSAQRRSLTHQQYKCHKVIFLIRTLHTLIHRLKWLFNSSLFSDFRRLKKWNGNLKMSL